MANKFENKKFQHTIWISLNGWCVCVENTFVCVYLCIVAIVTAKTHTKKGAKESDDILSPSLHQETATFIAF